MNNINFAEQVLWRFLTPSDFTGIHGEATSARGGGQVHITLGNLEYIPEFFQLTDDIEERCEDIDDSWNDALRERIREEDEDEASEQFPVEVEPIESASIPRQTITIRYGSYGSRHGWQIGNQYSDRYDLWTDDHDFPNLSHFDSFDDNGYYDDPNTDPPLIYFIRDKQGRFHARAVNELNEDALYHFPELLVNEWEEYVNLDETKQYNTGLVDFTTGDARKR